VQQFPPQVEVSGPLIGPSLSVGTTTCSSFLPQWRFQALCLALLFLRALRRAAVSSPSGGFGPSGRPFSFCWHHDVQQLFCRPYGGLQECQRVIHLGCAFRTFLPFYRGAQHGSEPRWCIPTLLTHASLCAKFIAFIIGIASYRLHHDDRPF